MLLEKIEELLKEVSTLSAQPTEEKHTIVSNAKSTDIKESFFINL